MTREPVATAIVLNYNGRGFVSEAVRSLLNQDAPGVELLVVDNASTDGTAAVAAAHGARVVQAPIPGKGCLLYTSPSPRDRQKSRMPSSA